MTPPNKKNGKKTHRTCSQYINLQIETIYSSIGPLVKKLLMLKVTVGFFAPTPPNNKNGKKTHRTCSQYIDLKIETNFHQFGLLNFA